MLKMLKKAEKVKRGPTDQPTDQPLSTTSMLKLKNSASASIFVSSRPSFWLAACSHIIHPTKLFVVTQAAEI